MDVTCIQHACPGAATGKERRSSNDLEQPGPATQQAAQQAAAEASADAGADGKENDDDLFGLDPDHATGIQVNACQATCML